MKTLITAGAVLALAGAASAGSNFLDIDLAGWNINGGYLNAGNTSASFALPVGAQIVGAEYIDLDFETFGFSWNSELRLSLNDGELGGGYWDAGIEGTSNVSGPFGPVSGTFADASVQIGGPFDVLSGELYVETYATYTGGTADFHTINSGMLRIEWIPTPGAAGLLGLAGLAAVRRRR